MYIKNTATSGSDFLDKLKTAMLANNWSLTVDRVQTTRELYFQNLTTNVIIGMKVITDNLTYYNLVLNNIESFNSANNWYSQTGSISTSTSDVSALPVIGLSLSIPFTYHLFINNNRLIIVANISNIYNTCYAGRIDAIVNPAKYPNPNFVAGHFHRRDNLLGNININQNSMYLFTQDSSSVFAKVKLPNNSFVNVSSSELSGLATFYPMYNPGVDNNDWFYTFDTNEVERVLIFGPSEPLGYLDGVVRIFGSGFSTCSEFTIGSDTYIIFPNIYRITQYTYYAIKKA